MSRKSGDAVACKCVERQQQAVIALLNQVQHVNAGRTMPFCDGYDHSEVPFNQAHARGFRLLVAGQHMSRELDFFGPRQWRTRTDFAQIESDGIVIVFYAHVMDRSYASNSFGSDRCLLFMNQRTFQALPAEGLAAGSIDLLLNP